MARFKTRLRLHVCEELLGTRITPSARRRDPYNARRPVAHQLTADQRELWQTLFGCAPKTLFLGKLDDLMKELPSKLPATGSVDLVLAPGKIYIEVLLK